MLGSKAPEFCESLSTALLTLRLSNKKTYRNDKIMEPNRSAFQQSTDKTAYQQVTI